MEGQKRVEQDLAQKRKQVLTLKQSIDKQSSAHVSWMVHILVFVHPFSLQSLIVISGRAHTATGKSIKPVLQILLSHTIILPALHEEITRMTSFR